MSTKVLDIQNKNSRYVQTFLHGEYREEKEEFVSERLLDLLLFVCL